MDYRREDGTLMHHADAADTSKCREITAEMEGVDRRLGENHNFFSPYYRQVTMESYTSKKELSKRFPTAEADIREAFNLYINEMNGGRPFILAGFSQGGFLAVRLLREMAPEVRERMVAAYIIGASVTADDIAASEAIIPARDSADTGVTICYNSVRDRDCADPMISGGNCIAINPVNWHTDATPARLDTLTVTLDGESRLLLVEGYHRNDYILPLIGREGNYHTFEIRWYTNSLRENMALRTKRFLEREN